MPSLGPGDGSLDHLIASWVYTGRDVGRRARCACSPPRRGVASAARGRSSASACCCGRAATSCGRCGSATSRTRPIRASPTACTSAATSRSTPACCCCCARACAPSARRNGSTARWAASPPPRSSPRWSSRRWPGSPRATRSTSPSTSPIRSATCCCSRSSSWPSGSIAGAWTARGCCSGLGQFANVVADSAFSYQSAVGTYVAGSWVDTLWPLGPRSPRPPRGSSCRAGRSRRSPAARCP